MFVYVYVGGTVLKRLNYYVQSLSKIWKPLYVRSRTESFMENCIKLFEMFLSNSVNFHQFFFKQLQCDVMNWVTGFCKKSFIATQILQI